MFHYFSEFILPLNIVKFTINFLLVYSFISHLNFMFILCFQKDEKEAPEAYIVQRYIEDPYLIGSKFLLGVNQ